ncbi:MAG: polymorphic toxin-type HINT domain-containing protein, partial [Planctomycetales bacterium]
YAVFSDNATIRREATEHLSGRRYEDFVPHMVALMATETRATLTTSRRNHSGISSILLEPEIAVHLKLERVTDEQIQIAHSHLRLVAKIVRVIGFGLPGEELLRGRGYGQATLDFDSRIHSTKRRIDEANELTTQLNGRVSLVLSAVAGRSSNNDPEYWWAWWNAERDVDAGDKAVVEISEDDTVLQEPFVLRWSCFAAETAVWTETGLKPIESIRIGDRVLSKNVESGELAFRSVLKTTVRKAKPLVVIRSDGEEIKATGGHQFWQSGRGWVKARDLEAFGRLHTVTGNAFVNDVRPGPTEQTYNLVVEDSHTYFVGKAGLLVQDLLLTAPTNMVVPGLTRFEMQNLSHVE